MISDTNRLRMITVIDNMELWLNYVLTMQENGFRIRILPAEFLGKRSNGYLEKYSVRLQNDLEVGKFNLDDQTTDHAVMSC